MDVMHEPYQNKALRPTHLRPSKSIQENGATVHSLEVQAFQDPIVC